MVWRAALTNLSFQLIQHLHRFSKAAPLDRPLTTHSCAPRHMLDAWGDTSVSSQHCQLHGAMRVVASVIRITCYTGHNSRFVAPAQIPRDWYLAGKATFFRGADPQTLCRTQTEPVFVRL
jgi:hypothetical protein